MKCSEVRLTSFLFLLSTAVRLFCVFFFFNDTATTEIYTLSLHDALPISRFLARLDQHDAARVRHALRLQRLDRRERGEGRVAVVGGAAAVELVAAPHRRPRAEQIGRAHV